MYPGECETQEDTDHKAETIPQDEFEILFDATMRRYRKLRKRKNQEGQEQEEHKEEQQEKEIVIQNG